MLDLLMQHRGLGDLRGILRVARPFASIISLYISIGYDLRAPEDSSSCASWIGSMYAADHPGLPCHEHFFGSCARGHGRTGSFFMGGQHETVIAEDEQQGLGR